jgi:hypothetical protein
MQLQGGAGFWQAMSWRWTQYREERVLASNALVLDAIQGGGGIGKQCAGAGRDGL